MTRRPAVTLIEVLVSMFIMAIGMLALLVLFPLGAISMGQALKDDRCASTASMAENVAIVMNIRHDPNVDPNAPNANPNVVKVLGPAPPLVYVDPYFALTLPGPAGPPFGFPVGGVIPRVYPSFASSLPLADRWFSLPDDIAFAQSGTPDVSPGFVDRGRRYSYAYLLSRPQPSQDNLVNLTVVVYSNRPVGALVPEPTFLASPSSANSMTIAVPATSLTVKIGGWILDSSGNFYRVTNLADSGAGSTVLEVTPNLKPTFVANTPVMVMEYVAEVFDKGSSWQP